MNYDTVLFDNDGVLVIPPARETKREATLAAFRAVGVENPPKPHVDDIVNGVTPGRLHEICAAHDLDPERFWDAREHHDEQSQLRMFRSGERDCYNDVTAITQLSQNCGVVSNNHLSTIEFVLEHFDLRPSFDVYYGREMTIESLGKKKPNPYYLETALFDLDADRESTLFVGDRESDIVAADRADLDTVFVRRSHCRDADLSIGPTYEVSDLHGVAMIAGR